MAVIINDFEVTMQTPPAQTPPQPEQTPPPIRPAEIADALRRRAERLARLQAW